MEGSDIREQNQLLLIWWAAAVLLSSLVLTTGRAAAQSANSGDIQPTAVAGDSWLSHLHRSFDETSMGKTGRLGPLSLASDAEMEPQQIGRTPESSNGTVTLHGSDLYRMNCRGCHGEDGAGAPPEINSVINPVRATSAATVMERMKNVGMEMSRADATKLAQQSKAMLLDRLHHGGQDMPAFPYLGEAEVNALLAYLRQLAAVRGAEREQTVVRESQVRVGEYIVTSTCHVCHSAAGPNPTPLQLYEGAIPPLNTLTLRTSRAEFIQKVTRGAPILMGTPPELFRGRMPVFYYLSEEEAADVYLYLTRYPPYPWATLDSSASSQPDQNALAPSQVAGVSVVATVGPEEDGRTRADTSSKLGALPVLTGFFALALMGFGFGFTAYELKRLSVRNAGRRRVIESGSVESGVAKQRQSMEREHCEVVA